MCTAISYLDSDHYFGRTLDMPRSYGEELVFCPRAFGFMLRSGRSLKPHYAMMGVAHVAEGYPLFYEGMNEHGLCVAGLNFPESAPNEMACAGEPVAQFELIPLLLGRCKSVEEGAALLRTLRLTGEGFSPAFPPSKLHWLLADGKRALTVEPTQEGWKLYENEVGVLTNEPPFPHQLTALKECMHLSAQPPKNNFSRLSLSPYCVGMGAIGLPGDVSSRSRFVRAAFLKENSVPMQTETERVVQFYHILSGVEMPLGCCGVGAGQFEYTVYTSCMNATRRVYYLTTYAARQISRVEMPKDADGEALVRYPFPKAQLYSLS